MNSAYMTHYYFKGTDPWQNIMLLPEARAYETAAALAVSHPNETSFGRFADFINYYPLRKAADAELLKQFIALGGEPGLEHPFSFVLTECAYLKEWFGGDEAEALRIPLRDIPPKLVSFTIGDSCARFQREGGIKVLTKAQLEELICAAGSPEKFIAQHPEGYSYIEVQLWAKFDI